MLTIRDKEIAIRERASRINQTIFRELVDNQRPSPPPFHHPTLSEVASLGRFDAAIFDAEYKGKIGLIENYRFGFVTPAQDGFTVTPGPSLEIKILKARIDSSVPRRGYYALLLPMNISEFGTMDSVVYLGTPHRLPLLQQGDILFGEAGFQKGRSLVLLDGIDHCTTNAHGLYARRKDRNVSRSVFFRCVFNWYRSVRLIDFMAVGGSGGHFSPEYFEYLKIPKFPDDIVQAVVNLHHSEGEQPIEPLTLDTFVAWHHRWNQSLGVWQLDRAMKSLRNELLDVQERIVQGQSVEVPHA